MTTPAPFPRRSPVGSYVAVLRRRWLTLLVVAAVTVGATAAVTFRTTPQYQSEALLFASTPITNSGDIYQNSLFSAQRVESYVDLVDSAPVAQSVIDELDLDLSVTDFRNKVDAAVVPDTVLMELSATDADPTTAQAIANATSDEFVRFVNELESPQDNDVTGPVELTVVNPAIEPAAPVSPDPVRNLALAALLGLILGIGAALLRQAMDRTIRNEEQLEEAAQAPLLGSLPRVSGRAARSIAIFRKRDPRAEPLRNLRTNLRYIGFGNRKRVFVVTSSVPGEGKTSTAVNLAAVIGKAGQRVVLVEGDLRRPQLAQYLPVEGSAGLTSVLLGMLSLDEALQRPHPDSPFEVLTSGRLPPNPAELIQSEEMAAVVKGLCDRFDVVIIDAPPLLSVTDGALLASLGDATVLVARHRKVTVDQVRRSRQQLQHVDARLAGTVMTMVPRSSSDVGRTYHSYKNYPTTEDEDEDRQ